MIKSVDQKIYDKIEVILERVFVRHALHNESVAWLLSLYKLANDFCSFKNYRMVFEHYNLTEAHVDGQGG